MIKMFIELDKEKIEKEGILDYEKMLQQIDNEIESVGGYKGSDGWYTNGSWEGFGAIASVWEECDWFMNNVKKWLWRNTDYEDGPGDVCIDDLLEEIENEKKEKTSKV